MDYDKGDLEGDRTVVMLASINTETWDRALEAVREWSILLETSLEAIRPILEEYAKKQTEAFSEFRRDVLESWLPSDNYFFAGGTHAGLMAAMEEMQRKKNAEMFNVSIHEITAAIPNVSRFDQDLDGNWLAIVEAIEKEQKVQKQLHKKKGKKIKNWEHNRFWHGRK